MTRSTLIIVCNVLTFVIVAIGVVINGYFFIKKHKILRKYGYPFFVSMNKLSEGDRTKYKYYNRLNLGIIICLFLLYILVALILNRYTIE